jgi:multidrug efflux pump subunit AcrA (membrane-fusion protein)
VKRSDTDSFLYKKATDTVINWWKKQREAEAAEKAAAAQQQAAQAAAQAQAEARARAEAAARSAGASGSGSSSTGFLLPDTAYNPNRDTPPPKPLPPPLTTAMVNEQLRRNGLVGSKPPASALRNQETFSAWIAQAVAWLKRNQSVAVRTPTGTKVVTTKPKATNRNPVIR